MIAILMLFQIVCIGAVPLSAPLLALSPSSVDPQTKYIKVKPTLQIADSNYANVFAIGDVADTEHTKLHVQGCRRPRSLRII